MSIGEVEEGEQRIGLKSIRGESRWFVLCCIAGEQHSLIAVSMSPNVDLEFPKIGRSHSLKSLEVQVYHSITPFDSECLERRRLAREEWEYRPAGSSGFVEIERGDGNREARYSRR